MFNFDCVDIILYFEATSFIQAYSILGVSSKVGIGPGLANRK